MIGKASNSQIKPVALGSTLQSSTYGTTIPTIIGRVKSPLSLIWAANLRQTGTIGKKGKGKKGKKGKGAPQYGQNVDFLVGHNPIMGVLQFWENQNQKYPLNFVRVPMPGGLASAVTRTFTIPDPNFYMVVGVTYATGYGFTANDYGASGPVTYNASVEIPCWNTAQAGPDPTNSSAYRYYPYCYYWTPAMGNQVTVELGNIMAGFIVYYAALWPNGAAAYGKKQMGTAVPAGALNLTFENVLGEGPEYTGHDRTSGQPLNRQQILYPMYAGLGSDRLDLGSSTAVPDIRPEVLGAYGTWATGDADFADMLEDIVKQGIGQAGLAAQYQVDASGNIVTGQGGTLYTPPFTLLQRGLGAFDLPGPIQKKIAGDVEEFTMQGPVYYDQPNPKGAILVVATTTGAVNGSASPAISDTDGNQWIPVLPGGNGAQVWYAISVGTQAGGRNAVTVTHLGYNANVALFELAGVDTFETSVLGVPPSGSTPAQVSATIATTNGYPCYLMSFVLDSNLSSTPTSNNPLWTVSIGPERSAHLRVETRTVYYPGTYVLSQQPGVIPVGSCLLAFKATEPSPYPRSLGQLLEENSLELTRTQCRAFGLCGSISMNNQRKASDWMETLYQAMNAAPVFSGFQLKSIPKSEMSYAGNGGSYTAPTAGGPLFRLTESDFITPAGESMIRCVRTARTDIPNILQVQCGNRSSDYYDTVVSEPESGAIALYSPRKDSPKVFDMVQDAAVARKILSVMVRERNYLLNTYKFTLNSKFKLLEPMDLVTIPDPDTKLNTDASGNDISIPVQFTVINENEDLSLECEAVPFVYGCHAPTELAVTGTASTASQTGRSPGTTNAPLIFEPVPRLLAQTNQGEVWVVVSHAYVPAPVAAPAVTVAASSGFSTGSMTPGDYEVVVTYVNANGAESSASPIAGPFTIPGPVSAAGTSSGLLISSPPANPYAVSYNVYVSQPGQPGTETLQNATPIALGSSYFQSAPANSISAPPPSNDYAGCAVYLSTNGGSSYNNVGQISGSATTGIVLGGSTVVSGSPVVSTDWPAANDPDTVNSLLLDLTESGAQLSNVAAADEDNFVYPCYVDGGGVSSFIPYELMTYAVATMTSAYHYTLSAASPNHLRRAVFGAPAPMAGPDHPANSRWALLAPSGTGILKLTMDPLWIGKTLRFKLLPVNNFGGGSPDISTVPVYPYTPIGVAQNQNPNAVNYTNTPAAALTLTNPTTVHMSAVQVQFPGNTVQYNARDLTIPSLNTTYYVTIQDPGYLGDIGTALTRTAYIETTQAKVGLPGYVYLGSIGPAATAGGGSTPVIGPGGWPPQQLYLVNGT